jgi:hypothetical protein
MAESSVGGPTNQQTNKQTNDNRQTIADRIRVGFVYAGSFAPYLT